MRRADTHIVNAQRSTVEDLTLETGHLRPAYQPVIELETGRMSGFEALLRCERAFGEPIAPGPFVQIAEETGLIVPIGAWILGRHATEPLGGRAITPRRPISSYP